MKEDAHNRIACSVQILTLNSADTLARCLESVQRFDDIIVLDGNSTDDTRAIARRYGARVESQSDAREPSARITDFSAVRNRGLRLARHPWVLVLDSDEYLSVEAAEEIADIVREGEPREYSIYRLPRIFMVNGERIERCAGYPSYQHRFFYAPKTQGFVKPIHEIIKPQPGERIGTLRHPQFVPLPGLQESKIKWQRYLDMQQQALADLSLHRFWRGVRANIEKFLKYCVKYALTFVRGEGRRMPFWYEYYSATYHLRLIGRLFINLLRRVWPTPPPGTPSSKKK